MTSLMLLCDFSLHFMGLKYKVLVAVTVPVTTCFRRFQLLENTVIDQSAFQSLDCEYSEMCVSLDRKRMASHSHYIILSLHQFFPQYTFLWDFTDTQRVLQQFRLKGKKRIPIFSIYNNQYAFSNTAIHRTKGSESHTHTQTVFYAFKKRAFFQTSRLCKSPEVCLSVIWGERSVWLSFKCSEASLMYRADRRAARRTCGL